MPGNRIAAETDGRGHALSARRRPEDIGYKALAVNLSDLQRRRAPAKLVLLSIGLPSDDKWLAAFPARWPLRRARLRASRGRHDPNSRSAARSVDVYESRDHCDGKGLTRTEAQRQHLGLRHGGQRVSSAQAPPGPLETVIPCGRALPEWIARRRGTSRSALLDLPTACADFWRLAGSGPVLKRGGVSGSILWEAVPVSSALRPRRTAGRRRGDDCELTSAAPPSAALAVEQAGL